MCRPIPGLVVAPAPHACLQVGGSTAAGRSRDGLRGCQKAADPGALARVVAQQTVQLRSAARAPAAEGRASMNAQLMIAMIFLSRMGWPRLCCWSDLVTVTPYTRTILFSA